MHGGTYILGPQGRISDLQVTTTQEEGGAKNPISLRIPAHHEPVTSDLLIAGGPLDFTEPSNDSQYTGNATGLLQANCLAILQTLPTKMKAAFSSEPGDREAAEDSDGENADDNVQDVMLMVFPPGSVEGGSTTAVRALLMGPGTGSCPPDQCKPLTVAARLMTS